MGGEGCAVDGEGETGEAGCLAEEGSEGRWHDWWVVAVVV